MFPFRRYPSEGGVETLAATSTTQYACGSKGEMQYTAIDFGCAGDKCVQNNPSYSPSSSYCSSDHSAIIDLIYSAIKLWNMTGFIT